MALRTLGLVTLTGAAQPVLGDVTTAITPAPVHGLDTSVTVASNVLYSLGDRIVLEPGNAANQDAYIVERFTTATGTSSTTVMQCKWEGGAGKSHASGVVLQVAIAAIDVVVEPIDGGAGAVIIGSDSTVTAVPAGSVLKKIDKTATGVQPVAWHMAGGTGTNIVNTADAWMVGTAGDKVTVYALVL